MLGNQQSPGFAAGVTFGTPQSTFQVNASDAALFQCDVAGPGVTNSDETTLWVNVNGVNSLLVREGDLPNVPGVFLGEMSQPLLSDSGHVAFVSLLVGPNVGGDNNLAIVRRDPGPNGILRILARTGMQAPDLQVGASYLGFSSPAMNQLGQVAFQATRAPRTSTRTAPPTPSIYRSCSGVGTNAVPDSTYRTSRTRAFNPGQSWQIPRFRLATVRSWAGRLNV